MIHCQVHLFDILGVVVCTVCTCSIMEFLNTVLTFVMTYNVVLSKDVNFIISEGVAVKAVNLNGVEILLRMFYDWHRTDHHNRQTAIRKALLNSLKALVSTSKLVSASSVQARVRTKLESPGVSLNLKTKKVQYIKRPAYADFRERMAPHIVINFNLGMRYSRVANYIRFSSF